jgi:nucleoside phosphorylase
MERRRLQPEDYTVAWISALPLELEAATLMLDSVHHEIPQDASHPNVYVLGSINEHNIALVCLPAGQTGTNSASAVASLMKSRFPALHYMLLVGVGGGVPSAQADIRLGDVVVSHPRMGHNGVIQYDLGKSTPDGFVRTGSLNSPPPVLLSALSVIQSKDSAVRERLCSALSKFSHLKDQAQSDLLFEPTYKHVDGPSCDLCDQMRVIDRQPRAEGTIVHYGTIASGNKVIRDAMTRDKLSSRLGGVLCFEMEAAGLMNLLPCLVIRGVCDYADSHKNKTWQKYAAVAAAIFAKELLSIVPATKRQQAPNSTDLTSRAVGSRSGNDAELAGFDGLGAATLTANERTQGVFRKKPNMLDLISDEQLNDGTVV